jgi:hypothetical protein
VGLVRAVRASPVGRLGWPGGARCPSGVDVSARQLANDRRLQDEVGLRFPLVRVGRDGDYLPSPDVHVVAVAGDLG